MFESWTEIYSNSAVWRSVILYLHVGGLLIGGGAAVAADRATLRSAPGDSNQLKAIAGSHRVILASLAAIVVSGALMLTANLDTFLASPWYWTKMALVAMLLINGVGLTRAERAARAGEPSGWPRLCRASMTSLALWVLITFFGAVLPNV